MTRLLYSESLMGRHYVLLAWLDPPAHTNREA